MKSESVLKGALLVAGTTIGGGMLALPVLTSLGGFIPSLFIYVACWLFMACTGILTLEACLWMEGEPNLVSIAQRTLGLPGKVAAWILYIFMFYCLTLAYVVGCGELLKECCGGTIPAWSGPVFFLLLSIPFVYAGAKITGKINVLLMAGLGISYCIFLFLGWKYVRIENLLERDWPLSLRALPIAFTAFAYQGIVPTLSTYFHRNPVKTRNAILLGTSLGLVIYVIWQWLILGSIPAKGPNGLLEALTNGDTAVEPFKEAIKNPSVYIAGQFLAFFALVTSFLGVSLGLVDFLADGLSIKKTPASKIFLCALIFIPVLTIALAYPGIFLDSLDFAGGYGSALLLGLLPVLMVWSGRYRLGLKSSHELPGGRPLLICLILFILLEVSIETLHRLGKF